MRLILIASWGATLLFGEITASALIRLAVSRLTPARVKVPEYAWTLSAFSGSGFLITLSITGFRPLLTLLAGVALFLVAYVPLLRYLYLARRQGELPDVANRIGKMLRTMAQSARYLPAQDARAAFALIRGHRSAEVPAADTSGGYRPSQSVVRRAAPHVLRDVRLGPVPHARQVSDDLILEGVAVPQYLGLAAEEIAAFEPDDEDDLLRYWKGLAAGFLTLSISLQEHAESLAARYGLDPDVITALFESADVSADAAPALIMLIRRYIDTYGAFIEHVDAGGTIVENAAQWHGARRLNPGGQAA